MRKMKGLNKLKRMLLLLGVVIFMATPITTVYASSGWVDMSDRDSILYGDDGFSWRNYTVPGLQDDGKKTKVGIVEKVLSGMIYDVANFIDDYVLRTDYFDLSIDGIVLGRMSGSALKSDSGVAISVSQFDLNYGNPWGVVGAWIFVTVRVAVLSWFVIVFVGKMIPFSFSGGKQGRAELKKYMVNMFFFFFLMYALPYLIDYFIYARDVLTYRLLKNFSSGIAGRGSVSNSILEQWATMYKASPTIINALLFAATVCAGCKYLADYMGTAFVQTGLFGILPLVCLRGASDKREFKTWADVFFPNLLIPFIDSFILMMPSLFYTILKTVNTKLSIETDKTGVAALVIGILQLIIIWGGIPARNGVLKGISAHFGMGQPKSGLGGALALGAAALKSASNKAGSSKQDDETSVKDENAKADAEREEQAILNEANAKNSEGMEDIDELMNSGDSSDSSSGEASSEGANGFDANSDESQDGGTGEENQDLDLDSEHELDASTLDGEGQIEDLGNGVDISELSPEEQQEVLDAEREAKESEPDDNYKDIPGIDEDELNEMEGYDRDRYANLAAQEAMETQYASMNDEISDLNNFKDGNLDEISELESSNIENDLEMERNNMESKSLSRVNDALAGNIESNNREIAELEKANALDNYSGPNTELNNARIDELKQQNDYYRGTMQSNRESMQMLSDRNDELKAQTNINRESIESKRRENRAADTQLREKTARVERLEQGIENAKQREQTYAANAKMAGMSGATFKDASSFATQKKLDNHIKQNMVNYKNFDSKQYENLLSPEERAKFRRERSVQKVQEQKKEWAKSTVGHIAGAMGAITQVYNGPGAVAAGYTVGAAGVDVASQRVDEIKSDVSDMYHASGRDKRDAKIAATIYENFDVNAKRRVAATKAANKLRKMPPEQRNGNSSKKQPVPQPVRVEDTKIGRINSRYLDPNSRM